VSAALVDGEVVAGDLEVADGRVARVGVQPAGQAGLAVPGFVDVHVNGFAGVDFLTADADGYGRAGAAMAATGVTAFAPTFITSPVDAYEPALRTVAGLVGNGAPLSQKGSDPFWDTSPRVLGVHLEGPFLSPLWMGAHDRDLAIEPDRALADRLCAAGPVLMMTLAPERPGGLELVGHLARKGIVVSLGHSDADAETAHAAYDRGARAITHVHNAHRRWRPRDPGLGGVALARADVTVQAIVDHVHLAPESAYAAFLAARDRFCLVTDAVEAAGLGPGIYRLGLRTVRVSGDEVRLEDGTLAGSVLAMDQAVRNLVAAGATIAEAVHAAARAPALLAGRSELGRLHEGGPADVAVLGDDLHVTRTLVAGCEAFAR
jgi:N-acetylglucosamine-6-phosphate deacetylase